jgi:glycosyltransferase involved in cell wall biosynthesis
MKVLFLTNIPSPYTTNFFNELGKSVDLTVVYERERAADRSSSWGDGEIINFKKIVLKGLKKGNEQSLSFGILKHLKRNYDYIILGSFTTPTGILAVLWMKLFRIKYSLFSEGGIAKNGKGIKELIKKIIIRRANLYLSSCKLGDEYFVQYGADKDKIRRIIFTTLYEHDIEPNADFIENRTNNIPKLIAVGRFIESKGFMGLIEVSREINKDYPHELHIVGSGTEKDKYINYINDYKLNNIYVIDQLDKDALLKYYRESDIFVLPTKSDTWGLVIIEAMSQGLPIITTNTCVAGREFVDQNSGLLYDYSNLIELKNSLVQLINDNKLMKQLSYNNYIKMKDYTFENMVKGHLDILNSEYKKRLTRTK